MHKMGIVLVRLSKIDNSFCGNGRLDFFCAPPVFPNEFIGAKRELYYQIFSPLNVQNGESNRFSLSGSGVQR